MKRINFFVIFLLLPIIIFCFSSNAFAATHGGKKFPDLPEISRDVIVIIYESASDRYRLVMADSMEYSRGIRNFRFWGASDSRVKAYFWYPEVSDYWEEYDSKAYMTVYFGEGGDGKFYDADGNERVLLYSNVDVSIGDFFFQGNDDFTVFYDHAIDFYAVYLEDYKPSWWDTWGSLDNFWNSISNFLGTALSPLFSIMETIGDIFEGFLEALRDIYDTITDFFTNFGSKFIDALKSLFIPEEGFLEDKLNNTKSILNDKFGGFVEMADNIFNTISQVVTKEFEGIKINFDNSFLPISGEYYIVQPGPINYYGYRIRPWISGLMIFLTSTYVLQKIVSIMRGLRPL